MPAGVYDQFVEQGTTYVLVIAITQGGGPFNLTGWTSRSMVRATRTAVDPPILSILSTGGSPAIVIDSPNGTLTITLTASITAGLPVGNFVYDLEIVRTSDGFVYRVLEGAFVVDPEVTR